MAYIDVIQYDSAQGFLKEVYDDLVKKRGKLAEVHKILSQNPEAIVAHMELYMTTMFGKSPLKRYQREMLAVVVSKANDCEYCQIHHGAALNHFWKDEARVASLIADYKNAGLQPEELLFCEYALELTKNPNSIDKDLHIRNMKELGIDDRTITDVALIISYFNFINRIVMGLGAEVSEGEGEGYNYD